MDYENPMARPLSDQEELLVFGASMTCNQCGETHDTVDEKCWHCGSEDIFEE